MMSNARLKQILLLREEQGQSIIIVTFAVVGIIFALGLALDLGLVYIERVALKRAIDAAVLGGVVELPEEQDAAERALNYLALNGYSMDNTLVYFSGCYLDVDTNTWKNDDMSLFQNKEIPAEGDNTGDTDAYQDPRLPGNVPADIKYTFWISTKEHSDSPICSAASPGSANKLTITGTARVDMNFMKIVPYGWQHIDVRENGTAQNVDRLDVVVVFDRSGSMEFDTRCYGCWVPRRNLNPANPSYLALDPLSPESFTYPGNGINYPVNYAQVQNLDVCDPNAATTSYDAGGNKHMIIEAELFSANDPILDNAFLQQGKTHWIINRGQSAYGQEYNATPWSDGTPPYYDTTAFSVDAPPTIGVHMTHMPEVAAINDGVTTLGQYYSLTDAQSGNAPRLEYDFKFRGGGWGTTAKIWVRMHGGRGPQGYTGSGNLFWYNNDGSNRRTLYWGLANENDDKNNDGNIDDPTTMAINNPSYIPNNIQAIPTYFTLTESHTVWHWREIGTINGINPNNLYRLYLYAGSAGFSIDRIVITNNTDNVTTNPQATNEIPAAIRDGSQLASAASGARAACDPCNPIYGHNIVANGTKDASNPNEFELQDCTFYKYTVPVNQADWRFNPIFSDFENPMRVAKEAVKTFATSENGLDPSRDQLGIVPYNNADSYLATRTELDCLRRLGKDQCVTNAFANVLTNIEGIVAGGGTNIGAGMKDGLEVLGIDIYNQGRVQNACNGVPCSRGSSAVRVMIVMTDGEPNEQPGGACIAAGGPSWPGNTNAAHRCPLWFAQQAALNGVNLYVIGLGGGVNQDYLRTMAEFGNGQFYYSATGADLNQVFAQILSNIYVRLVR